MFPLLYDYIVAIFINQWLRWVWTCGRGSPLRPCGPCRWLTRLSVEKKTSVEHVEIYHWLANVSMCLLVVDGGWWWLMVVNGSWWWLMVVDGGWWWLMVVDGGWWWLMVVNNEHSFYFVYLWPKSIWKAGGPKSQPGTLANSRDHDVGNLAQVHNWTTPTKHGHGPGSEVLTPQKKTPIVEGKTRQNACDQLLSFAACWVWL